MMRLQYIGSVEKTLVDVAALSNGTIISVDDVLGNKLLAHFPDEYVLVESEIATQDEPKDGTPVDTTEAMSPTETTNTKPAATAAVDPASQL